MNNFERTMQAAEKLAKKYGSLLIPSDSAKEPEPLPNKLILQPGCETEYVEQEADHAPRGEWFAGLKELCPLRETDNIASGADYPKSAMEKPTEEFARNCIAAHLGTTPDKIVNVEVTPDGKGGWHFNGNLKVDKPRRFGFIQG